MSVSTQERLFEGADWDFGTLQRIHDACAEVASSDLGLTLYPNQIEVITAEQMLDAYASIGMPLFYKHWSFGKHFAHHEALYRKGMRGLAYEIVINSSPCISYLMEENTATMQALVIAHAAFGHNHFFRNNYLFKQWTDADGILDYLSFAKAYVTSCEESYGQAAVERTLDAAHALMSHGVHRHPQKKKHDLRAGGAAPARAARLHDEQVFNDLWRTVPAGPGKSPSDLTLERRKALLQLPQENILYFLEKSAPRLQAWQRELLRIVRLVAQYFYPQGPDEGDERGHRHLCSLPASCRVCARCGRICRTGNFFEFLQSHTNVVFQPTYDDPRYSGFNPYALGFAMMQDIERIVTEPDDEDRDWFPDIAGKGDAMGVLRDIWANYRDESFIGQFLSPRLMRQLRLFHLQRRSRRDRDPRSTASMTSVAIARSAARSPASTTSAGSTPISRSSTPISPGDRRLSSTTPSLNPSPSRRNRRPHVPAAPRRSMGLRRRAEGGRSATVLKEHVVSPRAGGFGHH